MRLSPSLSVLCTLAVATSSAAQRFAPAPTHAADIHYDEHGLPHVFGKTDAGVLYGLGYQQARDYPVGTLNMLWLHSGRMAEIAGESYLDEDRLLRLWEVPEHVASQRADLEARGVIHLFEAYVAGIEKGRAWWRGSGDPAESKRLDSLLGEDLEIWIDPVPDYLNQAFSPFGSHDDPEVPLRMRETLNRLFDESKPITVEHVLSLGVCINSFFLLRNNPVPLNAMPTGQQQDDPIDPRPGEAYGNNALDQSTKASNGWMIGLPAALGGDVLTSSDSHVALNRLNIRPYLVQISGKQLKATGLCMPGYPAVYMGFNPWISWLFTAPTGEPVARNEWSVQLLPSADPEELEFSFRGAGGVVDVVALERVEETIPYVDVETGDTLELEDVRWYVPVHPDEHPDLGFTRYPVIMKTAEAPQPGEEVFFQQAAFSSEGCAWESLFRFAAARNAVDDIDELLDSPLLLFGNGHNLMVADANGTFRYDFMARIPRQGADVPATHYSETAVLDGGELGWRWLGYHPRSELPSIGPANAGSTAEIWINNNVTPDLIEETRFDESDLASYPEYVVPHESVSTWRQLRADELLRRNPMPVTTGISEAASSDVRFTWMHMMWPFFVRATASNPGGTSALAQQFVTWIDEYRDRGEDDLPDPSNDFEAHPYSEVTVYAVLVRSHYLDYLGGFQNLPEQQETFGDDPLHELFDDPTGFTEAAYGPNMDAMRHALDVVALLWSDGDTEFGLGNQSELASFSPALPDDPWSDPRFNDPIDPEWAGTISGSLTTRWGHVNVCGLTPHFLAPPKKVYVDDVGDNGGNKFDFLKGHVFSLFAPDLLASLPYDTLKIGMYMGQEPRAYPLAGVRTSLFWTQHQPIFKGSPPLDYHQSAYAWTTTQTLAHHPMTQGSQTMLLVRLSQGRLPLARFATVYGGTEITRPDLLGNGKLAHQDRFAPTEDFVNRQWNTFVVSKRKLGKPTHRVWFEDWTAAELEYGE